MTNNSTERSIAAVD